MAKTLQTPIIHNIIPFDPVNPYTVSFSYSDNQAVKNRAIIQDVETYNTVYDDIQIGMSLSHIIPANTLIAGKRYIIQIQVFDIDGNSSQLSEQLSFNCYSTPSFKLENVDDLVKNSSVSPTIEYSQAEGEQVKNFQFLLYDKSKVILNSSPVYYSLNNENNKYTFYSLDNNVTYYVRVIGETAHGIYLDTGYIEFATNYVTIPANTVFSLENNYNGGYVSVISNIKDVGHKEEGCNIENGILTIENGFLEYDEGFELDKNAYFRLLVKQLPLGTFVCLSNGTTLSLKNVCDRYYLELKDGQYVLYKEIQVILLEDGQYSLTESGNPLYIEIIRENNIYEIRTEERL